MSANQPVGFLAVPPGGKGPGVLVLHSWWGLNQNIRMFCGKLAGAGFTVFAPDLYHGKVADTIEGAEALSSTLNSRYEQATEELKSAASYLEEHSSTPGLAVIGFSLGASYAVDISAADHARIRKVVLFYGTGCADFTSAQAEYLGHFAGNDPYEPTSGVDELEVILQQAGRPVTFHRYPNAGHWFCEEDRQDAYIPEAAALAWDRTLEFLKSS